MNRIDAMFARKKAEGSKAAIFFVTAGFPNLATTESVIEILAGAGADLIELGIPFSDPIADGPTIQRASQVSLKAGTTVKDALGVLDRARRKTALPIIFFSAFNPVLHYGLERFTADAKAAGADGLLIPDLPPEEASELSGLCKANDLKLSFLVAPTTSRERQRLIASKSTGFIYYISLRGVTGAREQLPSDLRERIASLKDDTTLPVVVGFGISKPDHARQVAEIADGAVVGSALINLIEKHAGKPELKMEIESFAKGLIAGLSGSPGH